MNSLPGLEGLFLPSNPHPKTQTECYFLWRGVSDIPRCSESGSCVFTGQCGHFCSGLSTLHPNSSFVCLPSRAAHRQKPHLIFYCLSEKHLLLVFFFLPQSNCSVNYWENEAREVLILKKITFIRYNLSLLEHEIKEKNELVYQLFHKGRNIDWIWGRGKGKNKTQFLHFNYIWLWCHFWIELTKL